MIFLIIFIIWSYHIPALNGVEEDNKDFVESRIQRIEQISRNSGKDSFFKLQQKYDPPEGYVNSDE